MQTLTPEDVRASTRYLRDHPDAVMELKAKESTPAKRVLTYAALNPVAAHVLFAYERSQSAPTYEDVSRSPEGMQHSDLWDPTVIHRTIDDLHSLGALGKQ